MKDYIQNRFTNLKLNVKLRLYFITTALLFTLIFLIFFTNMVKYNQEYNQIVESATTASGFSIDFKSEFDYKMYRVIIGSLSFDSASPYVDINNAQSIATELKNAARSIGNRERAEAIEKFLINLWKHVDKIEGNLKETGHYDENISILDNDIRVLTSLIQDTILEYIYYDTLEMEQIRAEIEVETVKSMELSVVILFFVLSGAIFFSFIISKSISKPIRELSDITNQVAKGDLSVRSNIKSGAEVKILSDSLNIMIQKLSNLIETVKIEQAHLHEAELKLLQAQINPHFLYNTLDTIIWLAESGNREEVVGMVESLSHYFRTSLSKGNDMIMLKEEEVHVRSYLQIQQSRYHDILEYEIHIPNEIRLCKIPKITLQPLVENALYHGIKNKRGKGKITITGKIVDKDIILTVTDNGVGMLPERLAQVLEGIRKKEELDKDFYGLYNVNERIRLYYGENYGLKIYSKYTEGTVVEIWIPYSAES